MNKVDTYMSDGAHYQARAVLAMVAGMIWEESVPDVARWENCREQGYILSYATPDFSKQLNIAFFEHRNSDSICCIRWEQQSMNSITIETADFGDVYKDKYDVSESFGYGEILKAARYIVNEFESFHKDWREEKKG